MFYQWGYNNQSQKRGFLDNKTFLYVTYQTQTFIWHFCKTNYSGVLLLLNRYYVHLKQARIMLVSYNQCYYKTIIILKVIPWKICHNVPEPRHQILYYLIQNMRHTLLRKIPRNMNKRFCLYQFDSQNGLMKQKYNVSYENYIL